MEVSLQGIVSIYLDAVDAENAVNIYGAAESTSVKKAARDEALRLVGQHIQMTSFTKEGSSYVVRFRTTKEVREQVNDR